MAYRDCTEAVPARLDMAKRKVSDPAPRPKRGSSWAERREYIQNVALARNLAEWLTKIAKEEGRRRNLKKFTVAELLDPILRPWAWQIVRPLLERQLGTPLPAEPPGPPVQLSRGS